ncbi:MAG TPA: sigma-70 family RNA polymerase sigma factor [Micromonosporaceae bacterium]|jgi:RNA polymerase sigma factor (sigma-70 family)
MPGRARSGGTRAEPVTLADAYRSHYLALVRLAMGLVDDQASAEDLVQDVFARLARGPGLAGVEDPSRYLATAVVNRARSALRRRRLSRLLPEPAQRVAEPADAPALRAAAASAMWRAIRRLPTRQRQVVVLRFYAEWSIPEIAGALGISRGAVSSSLDRALTSLSAQVGVVHGRDND